MRNTNGTHYTLYTVLKRGKQNLQTRESAVERYLQAERELLVRAQANQEQGEGALGDDVEERHLEKHRESRCKTLHDVHRVSNTPFDTI